MSSNRTWRCSTNRVRMEIGEHANKVASDGDHVDEVVMGCASRAGSPNQPTWSGQCNELPDASRDSAKHHRGQPVRFRTVDVPLCGTGRHEEDSGSCHHNSCEVKVNSHSPRVDPFQVRSPANPTVKHRRDAIVSTAVRSSATVRCSEAVVQSRGVPQSIHRREQSSQVVNRSHAADAGDRDDVQIVSENQTKTSDCSLPRQVQRRVTTTRSTLMPRRESSQQKQHVSVDRGDVIVYELMGASG